MLQAVKTQHKPKVLCYVGFSVAGGTGTGIFYDIIHLIENRLNNILDNVEIKIFPLALMPSAFIDNWKCKMLKLEKKRCTTLKILLN